MRFYHRSHGSHTPSVLRREYLPELQRAREAREKSLKDLKDDSLNRFMKDLAVDLEKNPSAAASDRWDPSTEEGDDDDDDAMEEVGEVGEERSVEDAEGDRRHSEQPLYTRGVTTALPLPFDRLLSSSLKPG